MYVCVRVCVREVRDNMQAWGESALVKRQQRWFSLPFASRSCEFPKKRTRGKGEERLFEEPAARARNAATTEVTQFKVDSPGTAAKAELR